MLYTILKNNIFILNLINLFLSPYICKICLQNNHLKKKKKNKLSQREKYICCVTKGNYKWQLWYCIQNVYDAKTVYIVLTKIDRNSKLSKKIHNTKFNIN